MQYRKKPVVIEAWRFDPLYGTRDDAPVPSWLAAALMMWPNPGGAKFESVSPDGPRISIATLEGIMTAKHGDWIIRGVKGEIYPCKPDIFDATYEKC